MAKYYSEFDWWCKRATKGIKYRPDRQEVYSELYQHIEDRYLDFLDQGMKEDKAIQMTLCVMGEAEEIAPQLAAIHRPFWGYLYSLCKWGFVMLAVIALLKSVPWINSHLDTIQYPLVYTCGFSDGLNPYEVLTKDELPHTRNCLFYSQPDCRASSDGYTFSVSNVALWRDPCDATNSSEQSDHLYILLDITNPLPWLEFTDVTDWFWAKDSSGNYYYSNNEYASRKYAEDEYSNPEPSLIVSLDQTGFFTYISFIWVRGFDYDNSEWIELHYDRSGRDIVLHIDLTGGDAP